MKVKALKKLLQGLPDNLEVVLQRDPEGNGYAPCAGAEQASWDGEGEAGIQKLTPELEKQGYSEEDVRDKPCVILWPVY